MTAAEWEALLARIAPEGYEKTHPGVLAKLAALLAQHPGDEAWETGAITYLARSALVLRGEAALAFWKRAAEALPENLAVSDTMIRYGIDALGWNAHHKDIDTLLDQQITRTPQDAHLFWLRADIAFMDNRPEDAESLLGKAADLPPWKDKAGVAERGGLQVREAMDGPVDPIDRIATMAGVLLPDLSRYRDLANNAAARADILTRGMEFDRARNLVAQAAHIGRNLEDGGNSAIAILVGMAVENKALETLKGLQTSTGDVLALQETERRMAELQVQRDTSKAWSRDLGESLSWVQSTLGRYGCTEADLENFTRMKEVEAFLTPDEQARLRRLSENFLHEADDLRARLAATPPTP